MNVIKKAAANMGAKHSPLMTNSISIFAILFSLFNLASCKQNHQSASDKYFRHLNNYDKDSLQLLLTEDFKVTLTYTTYFYNRTDFFDRYLRNLKEHNEKTKILKTISDKEPKQFLVEDNSDYLKYLNVRNPIWVITVKSTGKKINEVIVDTTNVSRNFFKAVKEKSDQFHLWLSKKYHYENPSILYDTVGLLLKRLKEYRDGD